MIEEYKHVTADKITKTIIDTAKHYIACRDANNEDEWNAEEDYYNAVMDVAEELNAQIDWNSAPQEIFDLVAQDRETILTIINNLE